jgi:hypothetical protein
LHAEAITYDEVDAVIDTLLAKPDATTYLVGDCFLLDLVAAVRTHPFPSAALSGNNVTLPRKRKAAHTAVLLVRPEKP